MIYAWSRLLRIFLSDVNSLIQIERMAPIIYAPTVASVSQQCGFRFHRTRGMYFNYLDRGQLNTIVYNWPQDGEDVLVVHLISLNTYKLVLQTYILLLLPMGPAFLAW